jgi:hypothetical protein
MQPLRRPPTKPARWMLFGVTRQHGDFRIPSAEVEHRCTVREVALVIKL